MSSKYDLWLADKLGVSVATVERETQQAMRDSVKHNPIVQQCLYRRTCARNEK